MYAVGSSELRYDIIILLYYRIESRLLATMTVGLHTIKLGIIMQNYL